MKTKTKKLLIPLLACLGIAGAVPLLAQNGVVADPTSSAPQALPAPGSSATVAVAVTQEAYSSSPTTVIDEGWKTAAVFNKPSGNWISENLPVTEFTRILQDSTQKAFDVIYPNASAGDFDIANLSVQLSLKNATVIEAFQAMNLQFELNGPSTPVRWELILNGTRPTAILRVQKDNNPKTAAQPRKTNVIYIGNLINANSSLSDFGKTSDFVVRTIQNILKIQGKPQIRIETFPEGELLVVVDATQEQLDTVRQVTSALQTKASSDRMRSMGGFGGGASTPLRPAAQEAPQAPVPLPAAAPRPAPSVPATPPQPGAPTPQPN